VTPHRIATAICPDAFVRLDAAMRDVIATRGDTLVAGSALFGPLQGSAGIVAIRRALAR